MELFGSDIVINCRNLMVHRTQAIAYIQVTIILAVMLLIQTLILTKFQCCCEGSGTACTPWGAKQQIVIKVV